MNPYTQSAATMLKIAAIKNCKKICRVMNQPEELYKEKFNAFIREVGKNNNAAYLSLEETYRRIYNLSALRLKQLEERL